MDLQSCLKLQSIIDNDSNIELIEIWDKVLYVRCYKGRNTFMSKKGVTNLKEGIYINIYKFTKDEYKRLQLKYHPDKRPSHLHISKGINQWKTLLSRCEYRIKNRNIYSSLIESHTRNTSIFSLEKSIRAYNVEQTPRLLDGLIIGNWEDAEWAPGWNADNYAEKIAEQRAESQRWWKEELLRQRGRDKEGNKIKHVDDGTDPFL